jgi:hypothetical protein
MTIFPNFEGQVSLRKIKTNKGMNRYRLTAIVDDNSLFEKILPAYNRNDAIFRATAYFPNGRFKP